MEGDGWYHRQPAYGGMMSYEEIDQFMELSDEGSSPHLLERFDDGLVISDLLPDLHTIISAEVFQINNVVKDDVFACEWHANGIMICAIFISSCEEQLR